MKITGHVPLWTLPIYGMVWLIYAVLRVTTEVFVVTAKVSYNILLWGAKEVGKQFEDDEVT